MIEQWAEIGNNTNAEQNFPFRLSLDLIIWILEKITYREEWQQLNIMKLCYILKNKKKMYKKLNQKDVLLFAYYGIDGICADIVYVPFVPLNNDMMDKINLQL